MLLDVIVPGPWWNEFTYNLNFNYNFNNNLKSGLRVRVPFGKHNGKRAGFICAENLNSNNNFEIKEIIELIDDEPVLKFGLWELAQWLGKTYLTQGILKKIVLMVIIIRFLIFFFIF